MSRKYVFPLIIAVLAAMGGCAADDSPTAPIQTFGDVQGTTQFIDDPCGEVTTETLFAGQTIDVGTVIVANNGTDLCVTYSATGDWRIKETHLHIALTVGDIPQTKTGNPRPGKFAYSHVLNPAAATDEYCFPLSDLGYEAGADLIIAAHAVVQRLVGGQVAQTETAWGYGPNFPGANWATYLGHTVQECNGEAPFQPGEFRTQTQAQWGTGEGDEGYVPDRNDLFASCLPGGLVVGCDGGFLVTFTGPGDVEAYLPMAGEPGVLAGGYTDPVNYIDEETGLPVIDGEEAGELIGQVIALRLNVEFDNCNDAFGLNNAYRLADLVICSPSSPASGWTVGQVLAEAESLLGGCGGSLTPEQATSVLRAINENFVPDQPVGSYLCPPDGGGEE